jgi:beta-lactam-binding protein with PASTA domain
MRTWHIAIAALTVCVWPVVSFAQEIVIIPDVIGVHEDEAKSRLRQAGIVGTVNVETTVPESCDRQGLERGSVCGQSPLAGRRQVNDMDVWLSVQRGEATKEMPSLVGLTEPFARERLATRGFTGKVTAYVTTADVRCKDRDSLQKGQICNQDPIASARVPPSADVAYLIQGDRTLDDPYDYPPDIVGMSRTDAVAKLAKHNFRWIELQFQDPDSQCIAGIVCRSSISPGSLHLRASHVPITLRVGSTQVPSSTELEGGAYRRGCVRMTDLIGIPPDEAIMRLDLLGFRGRIIQREPKFAGDCNRNIDVGANRICGQTFPVGQEVCSGSELNLFVAPETELPQIPTAGSPFGPKTQ